MEGIYSQYVSSWARKIGSRTALLPGRVFDVPGILPKRSALSYSGNTVPDVSLFWGFYVHGLLEPRPCSIPAMLWPGAAAPPSLLCQPHPSHPFLHNCGWSGMPGRKGGNRPGMLLTDSSAQHFPSSHGLQVRGLWWAVGMALLVFCGFFHVFT